MDRRSQAALARIARRRTPRASACCARFSAGPNGCDRSARCASRDCARVRQQTGEGSVSPSLIAGYDFQRRVRGVVLDNVWIGRRKLSASDAGLEVGDFVEGLAFR
jgi:hypothetical protein